MYNALMIDRKRNSTTEVVADLNALYLMVSYVELELERIAPECISAASHLRSTILNETLLRTSFYSNLRSLPSPRCG
jgi:hypothetical protein